MSKSKEGVYRVRQAFRIHRSLVEVGDTLPAEFPNDSTVSVTWNRRLRKYEVSRTGELGRISGAQLDELISNGTIKKEERYR